MEKITKEEIKDLLVNRELMIGDVIDAIVEANGIVGVGLISLGDDLQAYCYDSITPNATSTHKYWFKLK